MTFFWIVLLAAVALLVWALWKRSAGQTSASLTANPVQSGASATPEPGPRLADVPGSPPLISTVRAIAPGQRPGTSAARWIAPGESVNVRGFTLPGGMLYVGSGLPAVKEWALSAEPALLNPMLPVDRSAADSEGRLMPYWPSYSSVPAACRSAYLQWLAGDRSVPTIGIGYVFLFFYGLERRLLFDSSRSEIPSTEVDAIRSEVARLLGIYRTNNSFRRYASTFHDLGLLLRRSVDVDEIKPPQQRDGWELPLATRLALGVLASEEKPLPAEWALSWILTAPEVPLRTPAQRCPEEFRELFLLRYRDSFGDGMRLRSNKTRLKIDYQPASASFGGMVMLTTDLPDVARTSATLDRLRSLVEQCSQDLDAFSRWVGRTGETGSPPAIALLPTCLARGRGNEATLALGEWLEGQLDGRDLAPKQAHEGRRGTEDSNSYPAGLYLRPDCAC